MLTNIQSLFLYIAVFSISAIIFSFFERAKRKFSRILIFLLSALIPSILAWKRYGVGTDYFSYYNIFTYMTGTSILSISFRDWLEPGFQFIVRVSRLFGDARFVFGVMSFLTITFFLLGIVKWNGQISLGMSYFLYLFLFYYISFNATRQMLSASIAFFALQHIKENRLKTVVWILAAMSVHLISAFVLVVIPLWRKDTNKVNRQVAMMFLIVFFGAVLFLRPLVEIITSFLGRYRYGFESQTNRDFWFKLLSSIIVFSFMRKMEKRNKELSLFCWMYYFSVIVSISGFFAPYIKRIVYPLSMSICILFPSILNTIKLDTNRPIIRSFIFIGTIGFFTLSTYVTGGQGIFPFCYLS